jgi:hypothetical protein
MSSRLASSLVLAGGVIGLVLAAPRSAAGQSPDSAATASAAPTPAVRRVAIAKTVFGDAGVIINARSDGFIEIAAAGPKKPILLQLRTLAARAWVDSTYRMLKARPRRSAKTRTYRSDIEEHASSGTMVLTRRVTSGESTYSLFFSDDPLSGFTVPIERSEADVFVATVRRAVAAATKMAERPDSATRTESVKPRPKGKKPVAKP